MQDRALTQRLVMLGLPVVVTLLLGAVLVRVAQLQMAPSAELREHQKPRVTAKPELPLRGDLMDRRGRLLSATRFGYRVLVDPVLLPEPPHEAIVKLARAIELPEEEVGSRIIGALAENQRRLALAAPKVESPGGGEQPPPAAEAPKPIRYLPIGDVLSPDHEQAVRELKIRGVSLERQQVREYPGGSEVASIVGFVGFGHTGLLGAERALNTELAGQKGKTAFVRDLSGRPLWVEPGQIQPALPGQDVRLSIDLELQRMAHEELARRVEECNAAGGRLVMVDPNTGEVLAMVDIMREVPDAVPYPWPNALKKGERAPAGGDLPTTRQRYITLTKDEGREKHPAMARNRCVEDVYEPGSTFKPFVWATITELGLAKPEEIFDTEGGIWRTSYGRPILDVTRRATMSWSEVLVNSSNIGMVKAAERLTPAQLHGCIERFGFGRPTNIGLPGESGGIVTSLRQWTKYTHTSVAYGHELAVTPVQMVRAFSAFARKGEMAGTMPTLRLTAATPGEPDTVIYRVLPPEVAVLTRTAMADVTSNMESRWIEPPPEGWKYTMFGKSGTAEIPLGKAPEGKRRPRGAGYYDDQYNSSFIVGAPLENPRIVVLVVIDDPGPELVYARPVRKHYGSATAGPAARRVVERALAYLGVDPSPPAPPKPGNPAAAAPRAGSAPQARPAGVR